MDDLEFVQSCVRGDKRAWDEFVDKYSRLIYNYIYRVLNTKGAHLAQEGIDDLFQEIFLALLKDNFKKLKSYQGKNGCSLATWLRQVTINFTIDYLRKIKPAVSLDEETDDGLSLKAILADNAEPVTATLAAGEKINQLKDCIKGLDRDDKYFLELHLNRGLSLDKLKGVLRISRGAIDMRKSRIISRLRECFESRGFRLDF